MTMSRHEELLNSLTHGLGLLASAAGGAVLIVLASLRGDAWRIVATSVFVAALVLLYTSSTLYHAIRSPKAKSRLKVLDHCAIYVLIAGTYTPFTLSALRGAWGFSLFGVSWGLAAAGIVFKLFWIGRFPRLSTGLYLAMGWLVLVGIVPVVRAYPASTLAWLLAGGIAYTAGTVFYHARGLRYSHAIWHLFVLAGSVCHAVAVGQTTAVAA